MCLDGDGSLFLPQEIIPQPGNIEHSSSSLQLFFLGKIVEKMVGLQFKGIWRSRLSGPVTIRF